MRSGGVLPVTLLVLLLSAVAPALALERTWRVGILTPSETAAGLIHQHTLPELARRGFVVGRNLVIEVRVGSQSQIPALARDLVTTNPDVVIAVSDPAIRAVVSADPSVPVVMSFMGGDPVKAGYATSLSRPGGRITRMMMLADELDAKRLEVLHELLPAAMRIAILRDQPPRHDSSELRVRAVAERLGLTVRGFIVRGPDDYRLSIQSMREANIDALLILSAPEFSRDAVVLSRMATEAGLPTTCEWDTMARDGCLIGYGPSNAEMRRRTGVHVAQILRGIPAGEIPIEGPVSLSLALNLRTARAIGIDFQQAILSRADEVIE